uniref:Uncharacterized protein n=1 Tax=Podoviridae sp. ct53O25 TaxID=2826539 RepID=A0A8S5MBP7_9CAUD|nr:MAG TPA: hypothetical protein [Podoviridae sp. ct53O25]
MLTYHQYNSHNHITYHEILRLYSIHEVEFSKSPSLTSLNPWLCTA